jgi:predicted nucleic acid-binding protein
VRVFVDTSALYALRRQKDRHHARARELAAFHRSSGDRYVGTTLVLAELHSNLLYSRGPSEARDSIAKLMEDSAHEWIPVSLELMYAATMSWLARFADQRFSLTDAVSFEVMRREKLTHAFAFDRHFEVAGFELLR